MLDKHIKAKYEVSIKSFIKDSIDEYYNKVRGITSTGIIYRKANVK